MLLYSANLDGRRQPSKYELIELFHQLVGSFEETFLILDALDECGDRQTLLEMIDKFHKWDSKSLHVMATSRQEVDIKVGLEHLLVDDEKMSVQSDVVDKDIRLYIRHRVNFDSGFEKWKKHQEVQKEIEENLMNKADGM